MINPHTFSKYSYYYLTLTIEELILLIISSSHYCPMPGCLGRSIHIKRHLSHCHKHLTKADQERILEKYRNFMRVTPPQSGHHPPRYPLQCSKCEKRVRRLDIHIVNVHKISRNTATFKKILAESLEVESRPADQVEVDISAGSVPLSKHDGLKDLLKYLKEYLKHCTVLGRGSITFHIRAVQNILVYMTGDEFIPTLSGSGVCKIIRDMDRDDEPRGFLTLRKATHSANYLRKVIQACDRLVDCLATTDKQQFSITDDDKKATKKMLITMSSKSSFLAILCMLICFYRGSINKLFYSPPPSALPQR